MQSTSDELRFHFSCGQTLRFAVTRERSVEKNEYYQCQYKLIIILANLNFKANYFLAVFFCPFYCLNAVPEMMELLPSRQQMYLGGHNIVLVGGYFLSGENLKERF